MTKSSQNGATLGGYFSRTIRISSFLVAALLSIPWGKCREPAGSLDALFGPATGVQRQPSASPRADSPPTLNIQDAAPEAGESGFKKPQQAPPTPDEINAAEAMIRELYEEDIRSVGGGQRRVQVVRMFLSVANDPTISDAETYAALRLAVQLAEDGDDVELVATAIQAFAKGFTDIDADRRIVGYLGKQERQATKPTSRHVEAALDAATRMMQQMRFADAVNAGKLANRLMDKMVPVPAAMLRDRVERMVIDSAALADLGTAAAAAQGQVKRNPDDAEARRHVGLLAVWQGDWHTACTQLQKCGRPDLEAAAEAEPGENAGPEEVCKAAGLWWKATTGSVVEQQEPLIAPVRRRIQEHAADLYERALAGGLQGSLLRREAEKRVAEVRPKTEPTQRPAAFVLPEAAVQPFDRLAFDRLESERDEAYDRFQSAARRRPLNQYDYMSAVRSLAEIRQKWCNALSPTVRDASLEERQAALKQVLNRNPRFADGHLCDCYLRILAGDEEKAKASLDTAFKLIDEQFAEQVFCVRQILDLAWAAVLVGEIETAKKINNMILKKRYPNEPAVLQVQAMLYLSQERPQFSEAIDKLSEAMAKTKGEERGTIAAGLAWLRAAAPLATKLRLPEDAEKFADEALELLAGRSWQAWRAKAELRASEKNWAAAIACLERAQGQAPLLYRDQFEKQRECYRRNKPYEIERGK